MADVLDDGEFWLPPQILADDDLFMEKSKTNNSPDCLLPYELSSNLSSPVESVVGSTETDSDEEDYLVGLTRQMARYTLEDDFDGNDTAFVSKHSKDWVFPSSPESTLCAFNWNCQSRVSSPPGTWTLLFSEVEEAKRVPNIPPSGSQLHQSLSSRATQVQHDARVRGGKKQHHRQHVVLQNSVKGSNGPNRPSGLLPSAWPLLQQQHQPQNGSNMRSVFLGNLTGKRELCAGTGVFLPRPAEPLKKLQAVPTVLLPARVVQALNLNLDEINAQPHLLSRFYATVTTDDGAGSRHRSGGHGNAFAKGKKFRQQQGISHEIRLPQEWTY